MTPGVRSGPRRAGCILLALAAALAGTASAVATPAAADRAEAGRPSRSFPAAILAGARLSVARAPRYDRSYMRLDFPGGDPGWERGACADLVVRAFRHAGIDLQSSVHRDIRDRPAAYGIREPDPSIDHRRVRNLVVFFAPRSRSITVGGPGEPEPGDIVVWDLHGGTTPSHIGLVSDRQGREGRPLVIHHMGRVGPFSGRPSEDDVLRRWRVLAIYRFTPPGV